MSSKKAANVRVIAREAGSFLRLESPGSCAMDAAIEILGVLRSELDAEMAASGWQYGHGLKVSEPLLVQLDGLQIELSTDGMEIEISRVRGSKPEFDELCDLVVEACAFG